MTPPNSRARTTEDDGSFMDFRLDDGRYVVAQAKHFGTRRQRWHVTVSRDGIQVGEADDERLERAFFVAGAPTGPEMLDQQLKRLRRMLEVDGAS